MTSELDLTMASSDSKIIETLLENVAQLRQELNHLALSFREDDLTYANQSREELNNAISMLRFEDSNRQQDTSSTLSQESRQNLDRAQEDLFEDLMQTRLVISKGKIEQLAISASQAEYPIITPKSFQDYLNDFKDLHPHLFDIWSSANLIKSIPEYKNNPSASCSVRERPNARMFKGFIAPHLNGTVLDVGCGPYSIPYYLENYPVKLISGIDPIEPFEAHPFQFVHGFSEYLPWEDSTFDTIVAATSLDHVLSLNLVLAEIRRVLKVDGMFLLWDWFSNDDSPYDPTSKSPELIDDFHLFHFSERWFEQMMAPNYTTVEKYSLKGAYSFDRFYALQLKSK